MIAALAMALTGCQTMADLDPTGLLSDDSAVADTQSTTPDLAGIPSAPVSSDTERSVASSLNAAGVQAQYSADALRAGTEAAAPPPTAAAPMTPQMAAALNAPPSASAAPPSAAPVASADLPPTAGFAAPIPVAGNAAPTTAPSTFVAAPAPPIAVSGNSTAAVAAAPVQTASAASVTSRATLPPGAEPAVPAVLPAGAIRGTIMSTPVMSDADLGFKPSAATPLDASVSNFVSAPILARYRQTASSASSPAVAAVPGNASGSVLANRDASATSAIAAIAARNGGVPPTAVVYFPGDGTVLSAAARTQIRAAATAFKANGGNGTIRVVGHASSRTANMPVERHLEVIFTKSQQRANAVARELMNQGVPAANVRIDAVGDSQPVYYESMPRGEEGNRRAEIYVQS